MGKKDKKKGKGAEKTAARTEKKLTQKMKKQLAVAGEDDIEAIVAEIEREEKKKQQVVEKLITTPPLPREFFTLVAHPEKDELILFGGEYFNGQETKVFNDLFIYKISKNEWTLVKSPGQPPPRTSHQAVTVASNKGEMWVFGGEFTTKSESQFYHYKDLWVLNLDSKQWEKVNASGGPVARSGHRMVCVKKQLIVFGGYHDNLQDFKYFNDVYSFNLDTRMWTKIEPSGTPPCPRSACQMVATPEGKILIWGGYSKTKVKKDVDQGQVHSDMYLLSPEKGDLTGLKWKWSIIKPGGVRPEPRSGISATAWGGRAYTFGGSLDHETEEDMTAEFSNEFYSLDLQMFIWNLISIRDKSDSTKKKRRRKDKGDEDEDEEMEEGEPEPEVKEEETVRDDGVFTMKIGPAQVSTAPSSTKDEGAGILPNPHPRSSCALVIKNSKLFLYGGRFEAGDRTYTLNDFYSLDIHKMDGWKTIIPCDLDNQEWIEEEVSDMETDSDSEDEEDEDENIESD